MSNTATKGERRVEEEADAVDGWLLHPKFPEAVNEEQAEPPALPRPLTLLPDIRTKRVAAP